MSPALQQPASNPNDRKQCLDLSDLYIINVRSLAKNGTLDLLGSELLGYGSDIAIVSETHFKKHHNEEVCQIAGFQTFRRDRKGRRNGGMAIYVQDSLEAREHQLLILPDHIELLWVEIQSENGITWVGALYHPPKPIYQSASLIEYIEESIEIINQASGNVQILLGGDFNSLGLG